MHEYCTFCMSCMCIIRSASLVYFAFAVSTLPPLHVAHLLCSLLPRVYGVKYDARGVSITALFAPTNRQAMLKGLLPFLQVTQALCLQGGFKKAPPKPKKAGTKKSSSAIAAAAAAEAKARAGKKGKSKDKSTFNQVKHCPVSVTLYFCAGVCVHCVSFWALCHGRLPI